MGEPAPRRSTLVSRLPIFRRSASKRQDSLPSSPSSGGVGNGVHSSSPSSTNSSCSSTGKRRSLFRAPSLGFGGKKGAEPRPSPPLPPPPQEEGPAQHTTDANGNQQQPPSLGFQDGGGRSRMRHSFGFGSHRHKKITRSQTEDFDKAPPPATSRNNVFTNCISSATNEGDDSGFHDDYSGGSSKRASRKKQLLPKSFSAHHRFSRHSESGRHTPEVNVDPPTLGSSPGSWTGGGGGGEFPGGGESSLQSPMLSEDRTTAITPSEFVPITEDSASEAGDVLPAPSPALSPDPAGPAPSVVAAPSPPAENVSQAVSASQVFFAPPQTAAAEGPLAAASNTDYETAASQSEAATEIAAAAPPPAKQQSQEEREEERAEERKEAREELAEEEEEEVAGGPAEEGAAVAGAEQTETSESEAGGPRSRSEGCQSNPEQSDRRYRNLTSIQEPARGPCCRGHEPRSSHLRKPHAASMCSSVSPYHEVMRMDRRLRSSSEGAGGPRLRLSLKEPHGGEGGALVKQRNNSSSSKLGSLDVLNNLGSSELDEDDLMLDMDLSDDQRQRHVSREDSSQSLASCLNLLPSPLEPSGDKLFGRDPRDTNHRDACRPASLLPADWCLGLGLGREEDPPPVPGLEALPLRLMQQDCTAVKTLLLRLRRTLQESAETSPASSLHSLPISPCSEKSLPFKESGREEVLTLLLRERDELILRLQTELECAKAALKPTCQKADRTTQTELPGPEVLYPGRALSQSSTGARDRRAARGLGVDQSNQQHQHQSAQCQHGYPASDRPAAREESCHALLPAPPSLSPAPPQPPAAGRDPTALPFRRPEGALASPPPSSSSSSSSSSSDAGAPAGARRGEQHPPSQIPRAVGLGGAGGSSSSSLHGRGSPCRSLSSDSERGPAPVPGPALLLRQQAPPLSSSSSSFAGRLGQPPRGPLSLHMYSRKNVFLQHSLHSAEIHALAQHEG